MLSFWRHIMELGAQHGVNPLVFAVLYVAHHPLFWGTMAWLTSRIRARQPVKLVIALGIFFWFLPYTYLFVFGRGLPLWVYALTAAFAAIGSFHAVKAARRRLRLFTGSG